MSALRHPRGRDELGVVVPSRLMVVAIVVVAIAAVMYVATTPGKPEPAAKATTSSSQAKASPTEEKSSPKASATPSEEPSSASPSPTKKPEPTVKRGQTFVAVFNNSGRSGLAARTATKVGDTGWKVVGTDNWYGSVPATTVYYPKRLKAAADLLAEDLGVRRVMPSVAPMRNDRLTVILTKDFSGA